MVVYLFGQLADFVGEKELELEPQKQTKDLLYVLEDQIPELKRFKYLLAVNEEIVTGNRELKPDDEIALLPPYAGG